MGNGPRATRVRGTGARRARLPGGWVLVAFLMVVLLTLPWGAADAPSAAIVRLAAANGLEVTAGTRSGPIAATGAPRWQNATGAYPSLPPSRCCGEAAYDAAAGEEVLFGGNGPCGACNDTYVLRGGTWTDLKANATSAPSARSWAAVAYDPALAGVVLFGGATDVNSTPLGDTWFFNGTDWSPLSPAVSPPARWSAAMAWDAQDDALLLFGGFSPTLGFLGDTWEFARGSWTELAPTRSPTPRWGATMVEDYAAGEVVLFGGYSPAAGFLGDTWSFRGGTWTPLTGPISPPPREKASMAFDPALGELVLYGGDTCPFGCSSPSLYDYRNDTWTYLDGAWANVTSGSASPPARCCASLAFDGAQDTLILQSGTGARGTDLADLWVYRSTPTSLGTVGLWAQPAAVPLGEGFTMAVGVAGPPGTLEFAYPQLPVGCVGANSSILRCVPAAEGPFSISVEVKDLGSGTSVELNASVTVIAPAVVIIYGQGTADLAVAGPAAAVSSTIVFGVVYAWSTRFRSASAPAGDARS